MRAILLNPGKKRKSKKGRKGRKSGRRRALRKYSKTCLLAVRQHQARRRFKSYWKSKKKSAPVGREHDAGIMEAFGLASNPRRKRSRRRNAAYRYGTSYRRNDGGSTWVPAFCGMSEAQNPYWVPRYASNPGLVGAVTRPFAPKMLLGTLPYVGGALGNAVLATWLKGQTFVPSMLKSGIGSTVLNLASAGLLGAGVGLIRPRLAGPVFMGGVVDSVINLWNATVKPMLGLKGCCGMDDYLTPMNAATATSLGDYITAADAAAARALGDIQDETYSLPDLPADVAPYSAEAFV